MFTIGDFARYGRVSVRMLRHYDAVGLLHPARVDPSSGYRFYEAAQLARLNRVIALKDLGFTLRQVREILDEKVAAEELRGMLRQRQGELETAVAAAEARLTQVEARLRTIESEGHMSTHDVVVKRIPAVRVAELSATAASFGPEHIGPVIGPLYEELCGHLRRAGVTPVGPSIAYYEALGGESDIGDGRGNGSGQAIRVHAAMPVAASVKAGDGHDFDIVELPAIESAATVVHRGPMESVVPTAQVLAHWVDANGYRSAGYARELYLEQPEDLSQWVTELQEAIVPI